MAIAAFQKTTWESWVPAANFADDLEDGETIVLATSDISATDKNGADATATILNQAFKAVSGTYLQIRVVAGTEALSVYNIKFKAVTSLGNNYELNIEMKIKNIP